MRRPEAYKVGMGAKSMDGQRIELLPLGQIKEAKQNSKDHDIGEISVSVGRFGFVEPLILDDRTGRLVAGHGRLETLRKIRSSGEDPPVGVSVVDGEWCVPVVRGWASKNDREAQAYLLASNRLVEVGGWIDAELIQQLKELHSDNALAGTGFSADDIDRLLADVEQPPLPDDVDDVPEIDDAKVWVKPGDVFALGKHVIVCGDSTSLDVSALARQGALAKICWTDPPWNVAYGKNKNPADWAKRDRQIQNDDLGEAFPGFCQAFCGVIAESLEPGAGIYMAMSAQEWPVIHGALASSGFHWSSTIVWAKDSLVLSRKDYHTQYEPIWYGWKDGAPRNCPMEDRKQSDVWNIPRPKRSDDHPTMKPVELVKRAIENSSKRDWLVFEPFSGSGTTILACELSGRRCAAIELDPKYVQVAIERWENQTHGKHKKL